MQILNILQFLIFYIFSIKRKQKILKHQNHEQSYIEDGNFAYGSLLPLENFVIVNKIQPQSFSDIYFQFWKKINEQFEGIIVTNHNRVT